LRTPEGKVKDEIKAWLKEIGAYQFWPVQTGIGADTVDCLACVNGWFVAIEVKPSDRPAVPTKRQARRLGEVNRALGVAVTVNSLAMLQDLLREYHVVE
jgi:hypothetical protein